MSGTRRRTWWCDMRPQLEAQCTTTRASEDDTTSETGTTYTRAPRVELQPRRTARNRGDTQSLGYLKIRPTKKTLVPGPQGDKGRTTHACRPQSRAQPRGAHPGYRRRGRRARQDAQSQGSKRWLHLNQPSFGHCLHTSTSQ